MSTTKTLVSYALIIPQVKTIITVFIFIYLANRDKYFIAMFYKGVLLKHMKKYAEAVECFKTIISE